jgi:hypothetical protein
MGSPLIDAVRNTRDLQGYGVRFSLVLHVAWGVPAIEWAKGGNEAQPRPHAPDDDGQDAWAQLKLGRHDGGNIANGWRSGNP